MRPTPFSGSLVNGAAEAADTSDRRPSRVSPARRESACRNIQHRGELCPLDVILMPFFVPLRLTMLFRKWLRRRLGLKAGNAIGNVAILGLGRPPLLYPCVVYRLARWGLMLLKKFHLLGEA
jgi:hypothetical protein